MLKTFCIWPSSFKWDKFANSIKTPKINMMDSRRRSLFFIRGKKQMQKIWSLFRRPLANFSSGNLTIRDCFEKLK